MTPKKVRRVAKLMADPPRAMIPGEDASIASITRRAIWCIYRLLRRARYVPESPTAAIPRAFVVRLTRHVSHRLVLRPSAILIFRQHKASL
jgi:hypothetical protein